MRLQKNAPFPTRQWLYILWFSHYRKITFLGITRSNPQHPSTKHTSMAIQLKTGNERRVLGFGFCNWEPGIRNSEPSLHTAISLKNVTYPPKIFSIANRVCPHKLPDPRPFVRNALFGVPPRINRNHSINHNLPLILKITNSSEGHVRRACSLKIPLKIHHIDTFTDKPKGMLQLRLCAPASLCRI